MRPVRRFYRRHLDPNRLTSEVAVLGGRHWRVTKQRGKIIGIEKWTKARDEEFTYSYEVYKNG